MNVVRITAGAQLLLSVVFIVAYFAALALFLLGYVEVATVWRDQIGVLLGVLTGGVATIIAFWFNRQRAQHRDEGEADRAEGRGRPPCPEGEERK